MSDRPFTLGVDLGGTKILAGVLDAGQQVLARAKKKTRAAEGPDAVLQRITDTAREAIQIAGVDPTQIGALGIGAPGWLDPPNGIVLGSPNLQWENVRIGDYLREQFGVPVHLANDVNAGTWGEYKRGAGRGSNTCLGVFVGTGIGGGIVLDGKLYQGAAMMAGEIGHMTLDPKGPVCGCGRQGCLEAFSSRTAMTRDIWNKINDGEKSKISKIAKKIGGEIGSGALREAWDLEDKIVMQVVKRAARMVGYSLGSAANLIDPDCIVLGGGVVEALSDEYLAAVMETFNQQAIGGTHRTIRIAIAELGDDAGIVGNALLARESLNHSYNRH